MTNKKESAAERLERLKREKEAATESSSDASELVSQLTHESNGEPDFTEIAKKLEERKAKEARGENDAHVKMTIYVEENLAKAFNALITKRGQQKEFVNQALQDFVQKKIRELGIK